jgi:hypothetical protein
MIIETDTQTRYGILLSGGIDSAILLYLLVKINPKINIQPFTIPKKDGAAIYSLPIIKHFNKKFNLNIPHPILVGDISVHHRQMSRTAVEDIFSKNIIDLLYNAVNKTPYGDLNEDNDPRAPKRDKTSPSPKIILPFVDMYKTEILQIMYDNNQEDLIDITHTCTDMSIGRCNICWQCQERIWAFKELGKIDTGVM